MYRGCRAATTYGFPVAARRTLPADPMDDKLAQLERLGNLKDRGVLSEAEFAEQKQRILNG